jgi:pilus assembly protein CpaB
MTYSVRNIAIALALAVAAAAAVLLYTSSYKDQVTRDQERVQVMVANQDIPAGTPGEKAAGMMAAKDVLRTDVTPGALQSSAGLEGKVAAHDIYADQQVVSQVFRTPTDQAAALSLDKTERGIRVNVDFASGALGAIKAGDHVDYFATFSVKPPGDTAGNLYFTRRLMTDVRVLEAPVPDPESGPGKLSEEDKDTKQQTLMLAATQADVTKLAFIEALKKGDGAAVVSWVVVRPPEGQASEMPITVENLKSMIEDGVPLNELKTKYAGYIALIEQAEIDAQNRANDAAAAAGLDPAAADPTTGGGGREDAGAGDASNPPAQLEPPTDTDPLSE